MANITAQKSSPTPTSPLQDLPVARGLPIMGHTLAILRDPIGWGRRQRARYGDAYSVNFFFRQTAVLSGADALEQLLLNRDQSFSAAMAYTLVFGHLTDTSLLMMDFDTHRSHRGALNPAFKTGMMEGYLAHMHGAINTQIASWAGGSQFSFYPAMKQLTLDVATNVFLGLPEGEDRSMVNKALTDILGSSIAVVRLPIPGTSWGKGLKAQRTITDYLTSQIAARRKSGAGDVFAQLCRARDENGSPFSDSEIIGHLMTFWIAGHDTLASSLSTLVYHLGKNPEWQEKLADEIKGLSLGTRAPTVAELKSLPLCGYAFREALRIMPPALAVPRGTSKETSYKGYRIPIGMQVSVSIYAVHHDENLWPEPEKFDPMRFAPENADPDRPPFAFSPFGGGAHKCIGMIFAEIQAKCFLVNLLQRHRIELPNAYALKMKMLPTPRPADGLPVRLSTCK